MSFYCLLACWVSAENLLMVQQELLFRLPSLLPWLLLKYFFVFNFDNFIILSWKRSFCNGIFRCSLNFMDLYIKFLPPVWELHSYYFLNNISSPFSLSSPNGIPIMLMVPFLKLSSNSCNISSFFIYISYFSFLVYLCHSQISIYELTNSLFPKFFIPFSVFFGSRISVWLFFSASVSLVKYSFRFFNFIPQLIKLPF